MKAIALILFSFGITGLVCAQQIVKGKILSGRDSLPIKGVTITVKGTNKTITTNKEGIFTFAILKDTVVLAATHVGYQSKIVNLKGLNTNTLLIYLQEKSLFLEDVKVISTGYQKLSKERATGSFSVINRELFNQQVGTDILTRLPAIANSVIVDNSRLSGSDGQMMVRGLSTIRGPKDPLIVIDNFPYDGNIDNINPNIVENITILKDASASSIWGARAANGVIVITTKTGHFNNPISFEFNSNLTIGTKPDLDYIHQISSNDFIDAEQGLFERNFYNSQINSSSHPVLSPVVDLLNKAKNGLISKEEAEQQINKLRKFDVRDQFNQYLYKPLVNQQYFLSAQGGTEKFSWTSSMGFDHNKENLGSIYQRLNLRFQNTYRPIKSLSLTTSLYYTQTKNKSGRNGYNNIDMQGGSFVPYMQIADANGNALSVARNYNQGYIDTAGNGELLDWNYYPLIDWKHQTSNITASDILASAKINYQIIKGLYVTVNYQYERQLGMNENLADKNSYMARDYINSFTQIINGSASYAVPIGGILDKSNNLLEANNLRGQLSLDKTYGKHNFAAIAGAETRSANSNSHQERFYGYNPNNLTTGSVDYTHTYPTYISGGNNFVLNNQDLSKTITRFVSQFANAAYTYDNRYVVSTSIRRDASNLFGLKTNEQWNPFWSAGLAWKLSNEKFYNVDFLPYINFRTTYGFSGTIDPAMVAVNTIIYQSSVSTFTGLPMAQFNNYYNPHLKWETSKMLNLAIDFRTKGEQLTGSVEYYHKKGDNLFGIAPIDYTTGVPPSMLRNVASMKGSGWDIELKTLNIERKFKWTTILNFSIYKDKIVNYLISRTLARDYISTSTPPISGIEGKPVYAIYAYKWAGLDPNTGEAQGYLDGQISKDYSSITGTGTKVEDLQYFGSAIPTKFGSLINALSYKSFSLQFGITFKLGYWFRRSSINYTNLIGGWVGHSDYALRWQKPGDELHTNVPVNTYTTNTNRDRFYTGSSVLVEKGDHVRLQYINLTYDIKNPSNAKKTFKNLKFYLNINNIGLLWKANKSGIDPDYNVGAGTIVTPTNYSIGIRTEF